MNVLVTGATGFVGIHLTRRLVQDGHAVRILARSAASASRVSALEAEVVIGDVTDPAAIDCAVAGAEIVYHLAGAFQGVRADAQYWRVNVDGTRYVIEAALRHGVRRLVHCSTSGVHGPSTNGPLTEESPLAHSPWNLYEVTKAAGERLVLSAAREHGLDAVVFRPAAIYGPGDLRLLKLFRAIAKRRFVMLGDGQPQYHTVYIDDLIDGILQCAGRPEALGEAFILAGPRATSIQELVETIAEAVGTSVPRWRLPVGPVYAAGVLCEWACKPLKIAPPLHRRRVDFFRYHRLFDSAKAKRLLGYAPQVDLQTGIERTARWYQEEGWLNG